MAAKLENRIWDKSETLSRPELEKLQVQRLRDTIRRVANVPFYKQKFAEMGVTPEAIQSPADVRKLPFTTKADLREHYPLGFLACDRKEIVRNHGSSGTTGKPTFVAYTKADREMWANLCARFLVAGGLKAEHLCHIAFSYGLFTGGFGLHYGIEAVGASICPAAGGNTPRHVMLMQDLKPDVLVCTPSYALHIAEVCRQQGVDPRSLTLRFGHFGGEPWTEEMRQKIEAEFDMHAFNNYGLSEVIGPGVSGECIHRTGMHIQEDHFLVECINPNTLEPVLDGQRGELVFTALTKEAFPLLRYRTRDIAVLDHAKCECGRTTCRMSRVIGRSDDMLIIRGVNVFPSQIEEALLRVEGVSPHYLIEIARPGTMDEVSVKVEISPHAFSDKMRQMQELKRKIDHEIHSITGIRMAIQLVEPQTIERSAGKAVRVVDLRKMKV